MLDLSNTSSILFVCLGNICRSPLADGIAKSIVDKNSLNIRIDSAGTGGWHIGEPPCPNSQKVGLLHGVDITDLKARQVSQDDFNRFDLIIALDDSNYSNLKNMGCKNLIKLGEFGYKGADIPDPFFYNGFDGFEEVYKMIDRCVNNLLDDICSSKIDK